MADDSTNTMDYSRAIIARSNLTVDSNKLLIDSLNPGKRCFCGWFHEPIVCPKGYEMVSGPTVLTSPEQPSYDCEKMFSYADSSEYVKFPTPMDTLIIVNGRDTMNLDAYTYHVFKIGCMFGVLEALSENYKTDSITIRKYMEFLGIDSIKINIR